MSILAPKWALWFLISLFSWHVMLILFKRIPASFSILSSIVVGIGSGYIPGIGHEFSLARTLAFFPFFLIGYWMQEDQLHILKKNYVRVSGLVIMTGVAIVIYISPEFQTGWLLASSSYASLDVPLYGGMMRIVVYLVSFCMMFSLFAWIPSRTSVLSDLGKRTMYVYLFHGFIIQYLRTIDGLVVNNLGDFAVLVAFSVAIVLFLSSGLIISIGQPLIEGKMTRLKRLINTDTQSV